MSAPAARRCTIRVDKFRALFESLVVLSKRTLPSQEVEMRVALLVKAYQGPHDATTQVFEKIEKRFITNVNGKVTVDNPYALQLARSAASAAKLVIKLPARLLAKDDLPKSEGEGESAAKNRESNATIVAALGPLFDVKPTEEEKDLLDDALGNEDALDELNDVLAGLSGLGDASTPTLAIVPKTPLVAEPVPETPEYGAPEERL
jgi:hypothetical protein